jgi:DNA ligase-1
VQLIALVDAADAVAATSRRLEKIARLAAVLQAAGPAEVAPVVAFLSGGPRQGSINIGHAVISGASDVNPADLPTLTITEVDAAFDQLAQVQGRGAARERTVRLRELFARATRREQAFLRRLLYGELRHGALEGVIVEAVANAAGLGADAVRRAAMMAGGLTTVARPALEGGAPALAVFSVQVMRPLQPMLAQSANSVDDALGELSPLGGVALEYKLDGARVQIHKAGSDIRIYSRTLHDVTDSAPDVVSVVERLPARELILDGEVLALQPDGRPRPFQMTMRRFGRRRDVQDLQKELPLTLFLFDCLHVDGTTLVDEPQTRRVRALEEIAGPWVVPRVERADHAHARAFLADAITQGHEGVMAKALDAPYAAGRRGAAWIKIKPVRTLDLVVLAAEWGHGRRKGWLSNLHLAARDPVTGGFVMLGKTFKGLTDQMLAWQTERFLAIETGRDNHTVFVRPEMVVEIAFNEIQTSAIYPGGLTLRFARVKRYRRDKTAAEADTIDTVRRLAGVTT